MCFEWMPSNTMIKRRNFCTKSNCLLGGGCQWEVQELNFAPSTDRLVWAVIQILPECIKHHSVLKVKLHARHQHTTLTWSTCVSTPPTLVKWCKPECKPDWPHASMNIFSERWAPLTISLYCGNEVSIQEEIHIGEIRGGSSVHHHLV